MFVAGCFLFQIFVCKFFVSNFSPPSNFWSQGVGGAVQPLVRPAGAIMLRRPAGGIVKSSLSGGNALCGGGGGAAVGGVITMFFFMLFFYFENLAPRLNYEIN